MESMPMLAGAEFDLVTQPVSTCYVPNIAAVYREIARVIRPGGIYISQHKQPVSLQASALPGPQGYALAESYYRSGPLPPLIGEHEHREPGALEFVHRWEQLIGDLCAAGFVIEARSGLLANPEDDHTLNVFDPDIRRRTDRVVIRARKR